MTPHHGSWVISGIDNHLSPFQCHAISWANANSMQYKETSVNFHYSWNLLLTKMYFICHLTDVGHYIRAAILQTTHSNVFSWKKTYEFRLIFHWISLLRVKLTILQHWFSPGDKPLSEPMVVSLLTYLCINQPQWFKWRWQSWTPTSW